MIAIDQHPQVTLAATQVACEGSAFLRNLILARLIGVNEMGLAVSLALGIRVIEMVGEMGLDRLLIQVEASALRDIRRVVHLLQLVKGICLACLAVLLAEAFVHAINIQIDPLFFMLAAMSLAVRGANNCDYKERQRYREYGPALFAEGGSNLMATIAIAPIAWISRDYTALAWASVIQAVTLCGISHYIATRPIEFGLHRSVLIRCLRYGLPVALNGGIMFLALQGDRLIVTLHFSASDLARFAIAAQLALMPALMGGRYIMASELPKFSGLATNPVALRAHFITQLRRVNSIAIVGFVILGMTGNTIIQFLYGSAYALGPEIFWLLVCGSGLRLVRYVPVTLLMSMERTQTVLMSNLPRLMAVLLALYLASHGGSLASIIAAGVVGEAASLVYALRFTFRLTYQSTFTRSQHSVEASL